MIIELGIAAGVGIAAIVAKRRADRRRLTAEAALGDDGAMTKEDKPAAKKRKSQPVIPDAPAPEATVAEILAGAAAPAAVEASGEIDTSEEDTAPMTMPPRPTKAASAPNPDGLDSLRATHPTE